MSDPFHMLFNGFDSPMFSGSPYIRQPFRPGPMFMNMRGSNFDDFGTSSVHQFLAQNRSLPRSYYSTRRQFDDDDDSSEEEEESWAQREAAIKQEYKRRQALQQQKEEQERRRRYIELESKRQQIIEEQKQAQREAYRQRLLQQAAIREREEVAFKQQEIERQRLRQQELEQQRIRIEKQREAELQQSLEQQDAIEESDQESQQLIEEQQIMKDRLALYNMKERPVVGDGNCQFSAVADQLFNATKFHALLRQKVCDWLRSNKNFEIGDGAKLSDFLDTDSFSSWNKYVDYMSTSGSWGDHITLVAISNMFGISIMIVSSIDEKKAGKAGGVVFIEPENKEVPVKKMIYLSHWHERHYGSLIVQD
eukprot:TRINITY_DN1612_c0_g1_i1.p1 TRINITY_DN1612_c0_g1~~TRINITY_DN1612_c0_g1_i1.p1  ORF type:complete len:365 (+),score=111.88 TRINITY_DN1612_c0_g1_i1:87-1181(+)